MKKEPKYINKNCPSCSFKGMQIFYEVRQVPVHSVLLMSSREMALTYRKGDISLEFCKACGFVYNTTFDASVHNYSSKYEETQGFSPKFNVFHRELAQSLIDKYSLRGKTIIEIGCGKGDFLNLVCEMGDNEGIGFDPAYLSHRDSGAGNAKVRFIQDFYSEKYANFKSDFVCCKMTLEHIHNPAEFLRVIRNSIGNNYNTLVFFQVPNFDYVLKDRAFWDIYYEHCSYFTLDSLIHLFRYCGFEVVDSSKQYDGQYITVTARPGTENGNMDAAKGLLTERQLNEQKLKIEDFQKECQQSIRRWKDKIYEMKKAGKRIVIWGGGSKGVAFLTTLNLQKEIEYVVDINPFKHGTFMAGTGHEIVSPEFLHDYEPDVVIVMNPVYRSEIRKKLQLSRRSPEILTV